MGGECKTYWGCFAEMGSCPVPSAYMAQVRGTLLTGVPVRECPRTGSLWFAYAVDGSLFWVNVERDVVFPFLSTYGSEIVHPELYCLA